MEPSSTQEAEPADLYHSVALTEGKPQHFRRKMTTKINQKKYSESLKWVILLEQTVKCFESTALVTTALSGGHGWY